MSVDNIAGDIADIVSHLQYVKFCPSGTKRHHVSPAATGQLDDFYMDGNGSDESGANTTNN